jgi:TIR domain
MMLFICHASEDRDFVRPLAEALSKEYEKIWYSEYELRIGDPLLDKIDEGLATCDFGIVVLSKPFFEKKWPRAELAGLFARETRSRKIILPIWKDITEDEVKAASPILASKVGVSTRDGLPKVLEEIRLAVDVSKRQRELTALEIAAQSVDALRQTAAAQQHIEELSRSERGANLVRSGIDSMWETIQKALYVDPASPVTPKFQCQRPVHSSMYVSTVRGMVMNLHPTNINVINSVTDTRLEVKIFRRDWDNFGQPVSELMMRHEIEFQPTFSGDEVVWFNTDKTAGARYTSEALAAHLIDVFAGLVQKEITSGKD